MSTSKDLREGVAAALSAAGVAEYRPAGYVGFTGTPVFMSKMPAEPDRCVVVTVYPLPEPNEHAVQVRCRGAAGGTVSAEDLADDARAALHGLEQRRWGGTDLVLLHLLSVARMGFDANDRDEVALNFGAITSDPSTSLID